MQKNDLDIYENKIVDKVLTKIKKESENMEDNQAPDPLRDALPTDQLVNTVNNINTDYLNLEKISNELETLKDLISNYIDNKIQETQVKNLQSQNNLSNDDKIKILYDNIEDIKNQLSSFISNKDNIDNDSSKDNYISFLENKICELSQKPMFDTLNDLKDNTELENEDLKVVSQIKTEDLQKGKDKDNLIKTLVEKMMVERSKNK